MEKNKSSDINNLLKGALALSSKHGQLLFSIKKSKVIVNALEMIKTHDDMLRFLEICVRFVKKLDKKVFRWLETFVKEKKWVIMASPVLQAKLNDAFLFQDLTNVSLKKLSKHQVKESLRVARMKNNESISVQKDEINHKPVHCFIDDSDEEIVDSGRGSEEDLSSSDESGSQNDVSDMNEGDECSEMDDIEDTDMSTDNEDIDLGIADSSMDEEDIDVEESDE